MKRVASGESLAEIGHFRNVLEHEGIACFIKNEQLSGALGEVPFLECLPELWVLDDAEVARAERVLEALRRDDGGGGGDGDGGNGGRAGAATWRCSTCGEENESQFAACWSCGSADTSP